MSSILTADGLSRFKYAIQIAGGRGTIRDFKGVASLVAERVYKDLSTVLGFIAPELKGDSNQIAADYRRMLTEKFGLSANYLRAKPLFPPKQRTDLNDLAAAISDLAGLIKEQADDLSPKDINSKMKAFWEWMLEPLDKSPWWTIYELLCDGIRDDRLVMVSAWDKTEPVLISQAVGPKKAVRLRLRYNFCGRNGNPQICVEQSADHWYWLSSQAGGNRDIRHRLAAFDGQTVVRASGTGLIAEEGPRDDANYYVLVRHPSVGDQYVMLHSSCKFLAIDLRTFSVVHADADSDTDLSANGGSAFGVWWSIEKVEGGLLKTLGL